MSSRPGSSCFIAVQSDVSAQRRLTSLYELRDRALDSACGPVECRLNDLNLLCPACGTIVTISGGREMRVEYLDLD